MTEQTPKSRTPVWIKIVLVLSLALNLAILGLVAGFVMRAPGPVLGAGPGMSFGLPYVIALDREDRRAVMDAVRGNPDLPDRRARRDNYRRIVELIRSDPLDVDGIKAALERQVVTTRTVQSAAQAAWLQRIEAMNAEQRATYADRIEEVLRRGPDRKKKKSDRGGG